ncbi:MAG: methyltransferase domain-containing protein, partial [Candidatus Woesearchaeota archaeon]
KWLNLAAGDGRYNLKLLKKADEVVACDIDASALSKLYYYTPDKYKPKLEIKIFNATKKFPFEDNSFDGIFCTGSLHFVPKEIFIKISQEIMRVLKPEGKLIFDFATDIKRTKTDGTEYISKREQSYTFDEAKEFLEEIFKNCFIKSIKKCWVEEFSKANPPYTIRCNFVLMVVINNGKRSNSKS